MLRRFFRDAFFTGLANFALLLKSVILIPLLSKKFGAIGYGSWAQVVVLVGFLTPILGLGIETGYARYLPHEPREKQARLLWSLVWFQTATGIVCAILLWMLSRPISSLLLGSPEEYMLVVVCGLIIYATLILNDIKNFFRIGINVRLYNALLLVQGFGSAAVIFLVYLWGGGVLGIVAAGGVFDLFLALICLFAVGLKYGVGPFDFNAAKKFISFGWLLLPASYAIWTLNLSDRLFLAHYRTLADIGIYGVAYALGYLPIQVIFNPIWTFYYPTATVAWERGEHSEIQRLFKASIKLAAVLIILAMGLMVTFYRPLIELVATDEFLAGRWLAPLICLGYVFLMVGAYGSVVLNLIEKPELSTYAHLTAAGTNIILNWLLIPPYGIHGAAAATCISFGVQCMIEFYLSYRHLFLRPPFLFIFKCVLVSGCLILVAGPIHIGSGNFVELIIAMTVFSLLYAGLLFVLRAYTGQDIRDALGRLGSRGKEAA